MYNIKFIRFKRGKGWRDYKKSFNTLSDLARYIKVLKPRRKEFIYILSQLTWRERQILCSKYFKTDTESARRLIYIYLH